ncbi:MAG TPA: molybdate ABC transporter substrate-binding protein [Chloroflexota bacterium]|nr:molybdate ABC transporter substrate-binding protein [Chloroflexota bacterium]
MLWAGGRRRAALLGLLVALLVLALARGAPRPAVAEPLAAQGVELNVFAAASLTDAFNELGGVFESQQPGVRVVFNYGPSSGLRTQIEQGAPADVFASADEAQMRLAQQNGVIAGEPRVFARNELVLITPHDNPGGIATLADLARPGLRLVTTGPQVPIGAYTRQLLQTLSADPAYGADFAERVLANVRSEENDVRAVVAKVALGEADGGIVYSSDVTPRVASEVRQIAIPPEVNIIATYPIAVVRGARQPELAERWIALVLSDTGQQALARWGFRPVN